MTTGFKPEREFLDALAESVPVVQALAGWVRRNYHYEVVVPDTRVRPFLGAKGYADGGDMLVNVAGKWEIWEAKGVNPYPLREWPLRDIIVDNAPTPDLRPNTTNYLLLDLHGTVGWVNVHYTKKYWRRVSEPIKTDRRNKYVWRCPIRLVSFHDLEGL